MRSRHTLHVILAATILVALQPSASGQQSLPDREYVDSASVTRKDGVVTVRANDPRPLAQALCGVIKQYNWLVDYEDAPYVSDLELIDVTDPSWRATHPSARAHKIPAGGAFEFTYQENPANDSAEGEEALLKQLVAAYNRSGNPGKFLVRTEGDDSRPWSKSRTRFTIVGSSIKARDGSDSNVASILDTPTTIPSAERSVDETLRLILTELYTRSGTKVNGPGWGNNALIQARATVGGSDVPARSLLLRTLAGISNPSLVWRLFYDADARTYVLNLGVVRTFCN